MAAAESDIANFYANRSVLITGATGFLGKALIEKFLRAVPDLRRIYAFIRPQKGQHASERWAKIEQSDLFDSIRKSFPDNGKEIFRKVEVINSDMMEPELGLSADDARRLQEDVSVVFHCAATIKFDEHIRLAVRMNILGTRRLLRLCDKMKQLQAVVHCSTAFCNCDRTYVMERVYPAHVPPAKLIELTESEWITDEMLDALTPYLVGRRPNTYTMTKALTENLLVEEAGGLPITIVRPSIVVGAWREPEPGWVDNYNGATGLMALTVKGLIRTLYGRLHEIKADVIPVDVVVNLMIVAGWHRAKGRGDTIPVIHGSSDRLNPVTWSSLVEYTEQSVLEMPLSQLYREPGGKMTIWRFEYQARLFLDHIVPAYMIDSVLWIFGKRRIMVRLYDKIFKVLDTLEYFYSNHWEHQSRMCMVLNEQLSDEDRQRFCIDIRPIDWPTYTRNFIMGIRKTILKESPQTIPEGFRVRARRRLVLRAMKLGLWAYVLRYFVRKTEIGSRIWAILMALVTGSKKRLYVR